MLTLAQQRTYRFIKQYIHTHGYSPTVMEVAEGIHIKSKGVAYRYIQALCDAKLIKVIPNKRRNIILVDQENNAASHSHLIPLLGNIAAGCPIEAIAHDEHLDVQSIFAKQNYYALKVKGDSMIEEGIFDGDFVICEPTQTANNGDIVVALIDGHDATLKRLQKNKDGSVTLFPANKVLTPMIFAGNRVKIQGRFVGLLRLSSR